MKAGEKMAYFPLFINLSGKKALIVGGGKVAERKAGILQGFDAAVTLVSPTATPAIRAAAQAGAIRLLTRDYQSDDMDGAALVIAATGDQDVDRRVHRDARRRGIPLNVADDPGLCTFFFPAVVHRSDFVIGVTTSGSYPALSKYARQRIEALFPENYGDITAALKAYREKVRGAVRDPSMRKKILEKLMETAAQDGGDSSRPALDERLENVYKKMTDGGNDSRPGEKEA